MAGVKSRQVRDYAGPKDSEEEDADVASFVKSMHLFGQTLTCPICKSFLKEPHTTKCLHSFCKECLKQCLNLRESCPQCRRPCRKREMRSDEKLSRLLQLFRELCPAPKTKADEDSGDKDSFHSAQQERFTDGEKNKNEMMTQVESLSQLVEGFGGNADRIFPKARTVENLHELSQQELLEYRKSRALDFQHEMKGLFGDSDDEQDTQPTAQSHSQHSQQLDQDVEAKEDSVTTPLDQHSNRARAEFRTPTNTIRSGQTTTPPTVIVSSLSSSQSSLSGTKGVLKSSLRKESLLNQTDSSKKQQKPNKHAHFDNVPPCKLFLEDGEEEGEEEEERGENLAKTSVKKRRQRSNSVGSIESFLSIPREKHHSQQVIASEPASTTSASSASSSTFTSTQKTTPALAALTALSAACSSVKDTTKDTKTRPHIQRNEQDLMEDDNQTAVEENRREQELANQEKDHETDQDQGVAEEQVRKFKVGDLVTVSRRMYSGVNKPGGVGRICRVHDDNTYDTKLHVEGRLDKRVPWFYIMPGIHMEASSLFGTKLETPSSRPKSQVELRETGRPARRGTHREIFDPSEYLLPSASTRKAQTTTKPTAKSGKRRVSEPPPVSLAFRSKRIKGEQECDGISENETFTSTITPSKSTMMTSQQGERQEDQKSEDHETMAKKKRRKRSHHQLPEVSAITHPVILLTGQFGRDPEKGKLKMAEYVECLGGQVEDVDVERATHVLVQRDRKVLGHRIAKSRTLKYVRAVCTGKWVLDTKWLKDSATARVWLKEDKYEMEGDLKTLSVGLGGPAKARRCMSSIQAGETVDRLLHGVKVYPCGKFVPPHLSKKDIMELVELSGGEVVRSLSQLASTSGVIAVCQDLDSVESREREKVRELVACGKLNVVNVQWLLNGISTFQVLDTKPYLVEAA